jgi:hypothetical protein
MPTREQLAEYDMDDDEALVVITDQEPDEPFNAEEDVRARCRLARTAPETLTRRAMFRACCRARQAVFAELMFFSEADAEKVRAGACDTRGMPTAQADVPLSRSLARDRRCRSRWRGWRPRGGRLSWWMTTRVRPTCPVACTCCAGSRACSHACAFACVNPTEDDIFEDDEEEA